MVVAAVNRWAATGSAPSRLSASWADGGQRAWATSWTDGRFVAARITAIAASPRTVPTRVARHHRECIRRPDQTVSLLRIAHRAPCQGLRSRRSGPVNGKDHLAARCDEVVMRDGTLSVQVRAASRTDDYRNVDRLCHCRRLTVEGRSRATGAAQSPSVVTQPAQPGPQKHTLTDRCTVPSWGVCLGPGGAFTSAQMRWQGARSWRGVRRGRPGRAVGALVRPCRGCQSRTPRCRAWASTSSGTGLAVTPRSVQGHSPGRLRTAGGPCVRGLPA